MNMGDENEAPSILKLPDNLDLNAVSAMHAQLVELKGHNVEVDAADVRKSGAQCVQVLLAAKKTWDADGKLTDIQQEGGNASFDAIWDDRAGLSYS